MNFALATLDSETIKNLALGISGGSILVGIILMKVVSSIIGKVVSLVLFLAIALAGFSQRQAITDCVDKVKNQVTSGATSSAVPTTCRFFGRDIKINVDLP